MASEVGESKTFSPMKHGKLILTAAQTAAAQDIAAGKNVLIYGKVATGKSTVWSAAQSLLHVTVPDIVGRCLQVNPAAATCVRLGEVIENPLHAHFVQALAARKARQDRLDEEQKGLPSGQPKVQLGSATVDRKLLSDDDLSILLDLGEVHPEDGKIVLTSLNSDVSKCTWDLLRSDWFEVNRTRFQFVGSVNAPDVLIVEGLNVLQPPAPGRRLAVSDLFDFTIYVDARTHDIARWYEERFVSLQRGAFSNPLSYFHRYSTLSEDEARGRAREIWTAINEPNLVHNILPTRPRASLVLRKGSNHAVSSVLLRKT